MCVCMCMCSCTCSCVLTHEVHVSALMHTYMQVYLCACVSLAVETSWLFIYGIPDGSGVGMPVSMISCCSRLFNHDNHSISINIMENGRSAGAEYCCWNSLILSMKTCTGRPRRGSRGSRRGLAGLSLAFALSTDRFSHWRYDVCFLF